MKSRGIGLVTNVYDHRMQNRRKEDYKFEVNLAIARPGLKKKSIRGD